MYDALNVLMAMNIISKEKKEIRWIGLPTNSAQECQNLEVRRVLFLFSCLRPSRVVQGSGRPRARSRLCVCRQVERQRRLERIKQKQSQLQELILQVRCPRVPARMGRGLPCNSALGSLRRAWTLHKWPTSGHACVEA